MQNITDSWFVQGMIKATSDAWLKGWDERNGGNLTLRLDEADIAPFAANFHEKPRYIALSQPMPLLANTPFIVTGSGKFFRNVQLDPAANLGVVKIDSDGAGYHILWGLTHDAVPPLNSRRISSPTANASKPPTAKTASLCIAMRLT